MVEVVGASATLNAPSWAHCLVCLRPVLAFLEGDLVAGVSKARKSSGSVLNEVVDVTVSSNEPARVGASLFFSVLSVRRRPGSD